MKVVYIVFGSIDYEGDYVVSVHASEAQANSYANIEMKKGWFDKVGVKSFEVNNDDD